MRHVVREPGQLRRICLARGANWTLQRWKMTGPGSTGVDTCESRVASQPDAEPEPGRSRRICLARGAPWELPWRHARGAERKLHQRRARGSTCTAR